MLSDQGAAAAVYGPKARFRPGAAYGGLTAEGHHPGEARRRARLEKLQHDHHVGARRQAATQRDPAQTGRRAGLYHRPALRSGRRGAGRCVMTPKEIRKDSGGGEDYGRA